MAPPFLFMPCFPKANRPCRLDAARNKLVARVLLFSLLAASFTCTARTADSSLAIISTGVSSAEDAPFVSGSYRFLPGDFVYVTIQIAGFNVASADRDETRKISLHYELTPQDGAGHPLTTPIADDIRAELSPEDKNWEPKRRASFLIPSFVAAGTFHVHVSVKDLLGGTEATRDIPFQIGGRRIKPASSLSIQNFAFFRNENDLEPLSVPAYQAGDTVYARFDMAGFQFGPGHQYHLSYGISVIAPDGRPYLNDPGTADLKADSFYPAQFIPGDLAISIRKDAAHGEYVIRVIARDLLSNQPAEMKQAFSIE